MRLVGRLLITQSATSFAHKEGKKRSEFHCDAAYVYLCVFARARACVRIWRAVISKIEYIPTYLGGIPLRISSRAIGSTGTGYVTARSDTLWVESL